MARPYLAVSAHQLDPVSWFIGRSVPLVFAGLILLYGAFRIPTWFSTPMPWLQPIAVALCAGACIFVYAKTRSRRQQYGWATGIITVLIGGAGLVVSAAGYSGTEQAIELWWAPFGLALAIASLAPYLSARRVIVVGAAGLLFATALAYVVLDSANPTWGPVSTMLIIAAPVVCGVIAAVTFSLILVRRMLPLIEQRSSMVLATEEIDAEAEAIERLRLARLTARAVPFLQEIARKGVVSPADRALAGQLARRLRDDLVTQANMSWLDSVAVGSRLVVIDPEHLAGRMRPSQRTVLRSLLRAAVNTPGADSSSLVLELRAEPSGAIAVALSLDVYLPEGRRMVHLAPHYLTLRSEVHDLKWDARSLSFTIRD